MSAAAPALSTGACVSSLTKPLARAEHGVAAMQIGDKLDDLTSSQDDTVFTPDPIDANKFYQSQDNSFNEMLQYATFLVLLWALWSAYVHLDGF